MDVEWDDYKEMQLVVEDCDERNLNMFSFLSTSL